MARRSRQYQPEKALALFRESASELDRLLGYHDLRSRILSLVPVQHHLRDLGSSQFPSGVSSATDRILWYFRAYPKMPISGDEITIGSGINEWPRRIRELRVEEGWPIVSGKTLKEMAKEGDIGLDEIDLATINVDTYVLLRDERDEKAAHRWVTANTIRKSKGAVRDKILKYLSENVGESVTGEELRYVANDKTEWARRVRELRTEHGWPVSTKQTGRPDLQIGEYVLETIRQSPTHDRKISDESRGVVLRRDRYRCKRCGWSHDKDWNPSDPRHLELHHVKHHADGGENISENLVTLCTRCHDAWHAVGKSDPNVFRTWLKNPPR